MKHRALIASAVATCAGVVLLEVYKRRFEAEVSGGTPVPVLISTEDIALDAVLGRAALGSRSVPEAWVERRQIRKTDVDKVIGVRTSRALKAGESVLWSDLAALEAESRVLSVLVPEGKRAVSLRTSSFDDLLRPGDRVDVLFTGAEGSTEPARTRLLVENVLVLAVGADVGATADSKKIRSKAGTLSVGVTMAQAEVLTDAEHRGSLAIALRNPNDLAMTGAGTDPSHADPRAPGAARQLPRTKEVIEHVR